MCERRWAETRLDALARVVLLEEQDRELWHRGMIAEGRVLVEQALRHGRPGPYQVQAAISISTACGASGCRYCSSR